MGKFVRAGVGPIRWPLLVVHASSTDCAFALHAYNPGMLGGCLQFNLAHNLRKLGRLRALYRDKRRRCVLFDDLHCVQTAVAW